MRGAQLQPFSGQPEFVQRKPGGIAARPRQAVDIAGAHRVGDGGEHNRDGACELQQRPHGGTAVGDDDVGRERNQVGGALAERVRVAGVPAVFHPDIAADGPARLLQPLQERRNAVLRIPIVRGSGHEHADPPHPVALLRARRERPRGCRAADERDELAPSQLTKLHPLPLARVAA